MADEDTPLPPDDRPATRPRLSHSQQWSDYAFGLAVVCLAVLALSHAFGFANPWLSGVLMIGITAAGTAAWAIQAHQTCPHCGAPYGYRIRVTNTHLCPTCGADMRE